MGRHRARPRILRYSKQTPPTGTREPILMQTRKQSLIETTTSVLIGYLVALASQMAIFPIFGIYVPFSDNLLIGLWFTAVSIVRGYAVRRYFNRGKK